jgi:hypothetical protein
MAPSRTSSRHDSVFSSQSLTVANPVAFALKKAEVAFEVCRDTCTPFEDNKKAPADVRSIVVYMKSFCGVLGALQTMIEDSRIQLDRPGSARRQLQNVASLLEDCVTLLLEIQDRSSEFVSDKKVKGLFKRLSSSKEDIRFLREHLSQVKLSLNLALSSLDLLIIACSQSEALHKGQEWDDVCSEIRKMRSKLTRLPTHLTESEKDSISRLSAASIASLASISNVTTMESRMHDFVDTTLSVLDMAGAEKAANPAETNVHPAIRKEVERPFQIYGHLRVNMAMRPLANDEKAYALSAGDAITIDGIYDSVWVIARPIAKLGSPGLISVQAVEVRNMDTREVVPDVGRALAMARVPTWYTHPEQAPPI